MTIYPKTWRETNKYLTYGHFPPNPGLSHQVSNLSTVCMEAVRTNRIPVFSKKFTLSKIHNPAGPVLSSWDRYMDITKTMAYIYRYYPFSKQIILQAIYPIPVLWLADLDGWIDRKYHRTIFKEILRDSDLNEDELIYRKPATDWWTFDFPESQYNRTKGKIAKKAVQLAHNNYEERIFFHRRPSAEVSAVVDNIVKKIGKNFWAIHIRRNDVLTNSGRAYVHAAYASNISWISVNLKCALLDKDTPIFLMTDEKDPLYSFDLQEKFNVVRAADFNSYKNLIAKYPDDNFLCFYIEKLIYTHAKRRYKTAIHSGEEFEFISFPDPAYKKLNFLPPHYPLPVNCKKKYLSYLSLEKKHKYLNKYQAILSLKYILSKTILQLRSKLGLGVKEKQE